MSGAGDRVREAPHNFVELVCLPVQTVMVAKRTVDYEYQPVHVAQVEAPACS
jgi:hypothetical protein